MMCIKYMNNDNLFAVIINCKLIDLIKYIRICKSSSNLNDLYLWNVLCGRDFKKHKIIGENYLATFIFYKKRIEEINKEIKRKEDEQVLYMNKYLKYKQKYAKFRNRLDNPN